MNVERISHINRRAFLKLAGLAGGAGILAACAPFQTGETPVNPNEPTPTTEPLVPPASVAETPTPAVVESNGVVMGEYPIDTRNFELDGGGDQQQLREAIQGMLAAEDVGDLEDIEASLTITLMRQDKKGFENFTFAEALATIRGEAWKYGFRYQLTQDENTPGKGSWTVVLYDSQANQMLVPKISNSVPLSLMPIGAALDTYSLVGIKGGEGLKPQLVADKSGYFVIGWFNQEGELKEWFNALSQKQERILTEAEAHNERLIGIFDKQPFYYLDQNLKLQEVKKDQIGFEGEAEKQIIIKEDNGVVWLTDTQGNQVGKIIDTSEAKDFKDKEKIEVYASHTTMVFNGTVPVTFESKIWPNYRTIIDPTKETFFVFAFKQNPFVSGESPKPAEFKEMVDEFGDDSELWHELPMARMEVMIAYLAAALNQPTGSTASQRGLLLEQLRNNQQVAGVQIIEGNWNPSKGVVWVADGKNRADRGGAYSVNGNGQLVCYLEPKNITRNASIPIPFRMSPTMTKFYYVMYESGLISVNDCTRMNILAMGLMLTDKDVTQMLEVCEQGVCY